MKLKLLLIFLVLLLTSNLFAQEYNDLLITMNNMHITCEIKQIKYGKVKYRVKGKSYAEVKDITNFSDIKFSDSTKIKNTLNLKIETPDVGYSYLYFYPANGRIYEIVHNNKLVKVKSNSYYLLKVESGKSYEYYCQGNDHKEDRLTIHAEDRKVYIIKGVPGKAVNNIGGFYGSYGYGISTKLVVDNGKLSQLALLTMKKKA